MEKKKPQKLSRDTGAALTQLVLDEFLKIDKTEFRIEVFYLYEIMRIKFDQIANDDDREMVFDRLTMRGFIQRARKLLWDNHRLKTSNERKKGYKILSRENEARDEYRKRLFSIVGLFKSMKSLNELIVDKAWMTDEERALDDAVFAALSQTKMEEVSEKYKDAKKLRNETSMDGEGNVEERLDKEESRTLK